MKYDMIGRPFGIPVRRQFQHRQISRDLGGRSALL
jgi:hypothetical protein